MLQLPGSAKRRLGLVLLLAGASCSAPDSSGLFSPGASAPIRSEAPNPDTVAADAAAGDGAGADPATAVPANPAAQLPGVSNGEGGPITGSLPPPESTSPGTGSGDPVVLPTDAGVATTGAAVDAGSAPALPPEPPEPEPSEPEPSEPEPPDPEPPAPPEPVCGGVPAAGNCWYVGALDQSCDAVCASRGGFAEEAAAIVGTPAQGGSREGCDTVLQALGAPAGVVNEGFREDGLGFGCHVFIDAEGTASAWWLTAPDLAPSVADPNVQLICGCVR